MVTRSSRSFHKACIWSRPLGWHVVHGSLHIDSLDYHYELLLAAWLRFFQFETLSSEGNENGKKKNKQTNKQTAISLTGKKKTTLHVQHTFFVHFFAVVLHDCNVKRPVTSWLHVLWRKCRTCSCSLVLFFTVAHFHPSGRQHPSATKFHVVPPTKMSPFVFCLSL